MKQQNYQQDERQQLITTKAIAAAGIFMLLCLFAATVYRIVTTDNIGWEFFAMLGACAVIVIARRVMGDVEPPRGINDRFLPTGNTKQEKRFRVKHYVLKSIVFASAFAVMDVLLIAFGKDDVSDYELAQVIFPQLSKATTIIITAAIAFVGMFLVSVVCDYLVGEHQVRQYNQMLRDLEDEE